jgi:uncharacterized 2Fe-2S/4Fe-4S cluster protein (DUF4445 family)
MKQAELAVTESTNIFKLSAEGMSRTFPCSRTQTLLQALIGGGVYLEANCGGRGACGKCKIQLLHGKVVDRNGVETVPQQDNMILACQVYPREDVVVRLTKTGTSVKGTMSDRFEDDGQPLLRKVVLTPEYPTLENHYSLQEMIGHALQNRVPVPKNRRIIQQLAQVAAMKSDLITVVLVDDKIVAVEPGDTSSLLFGLAFDIGTTTVAGMLVDINTNNIVAVHSQTNPQVAFGADVVSRIDAANAAGGLEVEAVAVRECLNQIVEELCASARISQNHIYAATIAGNATMEHLLLEILPSSLALKPYVSVFRQIAPFSPGEIDLNISPYAKIMMLPNVAGFVGADTTAAVLAIGQDISSEQALLIDLGTNGEIVLGSREKLFACSTAAGPAFEGAHLRDGMRAAAGAIEDVTIGDDVWVKTIGGGKAAGVCGSGIVKAIAEMLHKKIISASGRFDIDAVGVLSVNLSRRLKNKNNQWEFILVEGQNSATGADISITQTDIRQIQLVKAAICTGIQILLEKAAFKEAPTVFLAGAFGNYLDINSALLIGLLPGFDKEQVRSVGNAAGAGAVHALLSREKLARCASIVHKIHYVELAAEPRFQDRYLANLAFPEVRR